MRQRYQQRPGSNYKALYRKFERTINKIEHLEDTSGALSSCLKLLVDEFEQELGFVGGRIYEREGNAYVLKMRHGRSRRAPLGYRVPVSYKAIQTLLQDGLLIMRRTDPGFDETIEGAIGVSKFAAITVGEDARHIISVTIKGPIDEEHTAYALNGVRHIINMKLRQGRLHDMFQQARQIQMSMLPKASPTFPGYEIHGESRPADIVGGDLFDYIPQSSRLLGVTIADASGHGLPAALQARDVITGMRMGMDEKLKIVSAIERLNRVINRSSLSSRFVSLFYGEVETNGNFIYCNAGHPPALVLHNGAFTELTLGGLVLGPNPTARYERGFAILAPGDYVLMYTDGITEAMTHDEKEYGVTRLKASAKRHTGKSAKEMVRGIFDDLDAFTLGAPQADDRTVLVVRRVETERRPMVAEGTMPPAPARTPPPEKP